MISTDQATDTVPVERSFSLQGGLSGAVAIGFGSVLLIEGVVLHLWVASRSEAWAWAITALNVATLIWLWRESRAGAQSRLSVGDRDVEITIGNRLRCRFPRSTVAGADVATWRSVPDPPPADYLNTAKPLEPNVMIVLEEPVDAQLSLGIRKRYARIGIRVEDPVALLAALARPTASDRTRS
jgi:hypothetical protein